MRILVTGGTGYLGQEIVSVARSRGHEVVAAGHRQTADVQLDARDPDAVAQVVAASVPDAVIHTAYVQDGPEALEVNVEGSRNVARAAAGVRLVHLSTDVVFDGALGRPYLESDAPHPINPYGRSKLAAEEAVAAGHPGAVLVRTSLIYGGATPSKHEQVVLDAADGRSDAVFFTDELRTPAQVGDLARAVLELAALDIAGPLHVAGSDTVSRYELAVLVAARHGRDPAALRAVTTTELGLVRPLDCSLDSSRARALLTTELRGVRTVLA